MTSIKVKFRPAASDDNPGKIFYQVIHNGIVRRTASDFRVFSSEWDERRDRILFPASNGRLPLLSEISKGIRHDLDRFSAIVRKLEDSSLSFSADDVVEQFKIYRRRYSLFSFMSERIVRLQSAGRFRTSETYMSTLNSFRKYRDGRDIMLDDISDNVMQSYEAWLKNEGLALNSISFYIRILRAVYNKAVESGIIENIFPFRHVYTGIDKTRKRALPIDTIRRIKNLNLKEAPALDFARDLFILSFYMRGISFIDMAYLKKENLCGGYVVYRRRKTGQQLTVKWTSQMQAIIDKYTPAPSPYLIPILGVSNLDERTAYRKAACKVNYSLKKVAARAGLDQRLTMYVARHSWATAAKARDIPISVISKGMGHDSEKTTLIYLASLDSTAVDRANTMLIEALD